MKKVAALLLFSSYVFPLSLYAQEPDIRPLKEDSLREDVQPVLSDKERDTIVTLAIENDLFGFNNQDSQYTSGVRLSWFDFNAKVPGMFEQMDELVPTFDVNESTSLFYSLGHNIYTPDDITAPDPSDDQRPYAGFAYGSAGLSTVYENHMDQLELTLGVVGPWAQGKEIQKAVHTVTNSPEPQGWDVRHLENEAGLMASWRRTWPRAFNQELPFDMLLSASPHTGVTLGNIYTYAATGLDFRLRPESAEFSDTPLRVRPAMPGTGFFTPSESGFDWYLFAGLDGRVMGRNIFLDCNTFEDSPSVDKNYLVADANVGVALTFGATRLSYTYVYRTKEYHSQSEPTQFGAVSLAYRF